jgi:hypothetical protein
MMRATLPALAFLMAAGWAAPVHANSVTASCINSIKSTVKRAGVSASLVNRALDGAKYNEKVVRFSRTQPEFRTPVWDYMTFLVDQPRIDDGLALMKKHAATLAAVEKRYGVDRYIIAALWGIESDYGQIKGEFFLPHAMANLICANRKKKLFTRQLIAGLKLVRKRRREGMTICTPPGHPPSARPSSSPKPTSASRSTLTAMAAAIWSTPFRTRWPPPPISWSRPAGALVSHGASKSGFRQTTRDLQGASGAPTCRTGQSAASPMWTAHR